MANTPWYKAKMMTLVRGLGFKTVEEYFSYIEDSKINGNLSQTKRLFRDMPKEYRKEFLSYELDELNRNFEKCTWELLKLLIEEI